MRVLLALDLSPSSDRLVERAVAWTRLVGGSLHLRSVSALWGEAQAVAGSLETSFVAQDWDARRKWERDRIEELADKIPESMRGTTGVLEGYPAQVLVELSAVSELLVLGTHARKGLQRLFLGSVAEAVCRTAECPVLVLPLAQDDDPPERGLTAFCPIDVEHPDLRAAHWVRDNLDPDVRFELGHVLRYAPWLLRDATSAPGVAEHPDARHAKATLDDLAAAHELGTSRSHLAVANTDNPGAQLAEMAKLHGADLIAMPTHGRTGVARLILGSVTARVIQQAQCAVLVVR